MNTIANIENRLTVIYDEVARQSKMPEIDHTRIATLLTQAMPVTPYEQGAFEAINSAASPEFYAKRRVFVLYAQPREIARHFKLKVFIKRQDGRVIVEPLRRTRGGRRDKRANVEPKFILKRYPIPSQEIDWVDMATWD